MGSVFKRGRRACLVLLPILIISFYCVSPVQAHGGFALSGSFYAQDFVLPQGSSLRAPDVYVVVFNNTDSDLNVRMTTETPLGVRLILSEDDFQLRASEQKKVGIGVEVTSEAAPGHYEISVTAEPYRKGATGIQIMGAAAQSASLVVVGEGAQVTAQMVNPEGGLVPGVVRLFKKTGGQSYEVGYSETGSVEATVAPGSYAAAAYMAGEKLAEEGFEVAANEEKTVNLTVKTIYFEGFGVVPNYRSRTEELAFAQAVYTVKNLYKPVEKAEVVLRVKSDDTSLLDEVSLATLSPLEIGRVGLSYNYIPREGWRRGSYGFKLDLYLDGKLYATTGEERLSVGEQLANTAVVEKLSVGEQLAAPNPTRPAAINWQFIGRIAAPWLLIVGAGYILLAGRKKEGGKHSLT